MAPDGTGRENAQRATEGGFTYIGILVAVSVMGLLLVQVGRVWATTERREREMELLFVGDQIRAAIGAYFTNGRRYPVSLEDLLEDRRLPVMRRYLRRLYADPITGRADWRLIVSPTDGGIMGVASNSQLTPIKNAGFDVRDAAFEGSDCYCSWQFIYRPPGRRGRAVPSGQPPHVPVTIR
jgi:type II secretory pathway pseudopilin PulG